MYYFDYLRVRTALRNFAFWAGGLTILVACTLPFSHVGNGRFDVGISSDSFQATSGLAMLHLIGRQIAIPFEILCTIAIGIAVFFGVGRSRSLCDGNRNLHYAFTKPVSRERAALTTFAFDAAGIVLTFVLVLVLLLVPLAETGNLDRITFGGNSLQPIMFGFGVAIMWYAMVQAATCVLRNGSGAVFGISIFAFIAIANSQGMTVAYFPAQLVSFVHVLGALDPFVYLERLATAFNGLGARQPPGGPVYLRDLVTVYAIGLACLAAAVGLRKRMEV